MKNNSVVADIVANQRKLERKRWFVILSFLVIGVVSLILDVMTGPAMLSVSEVVNSLFDIGEVDKMTNNIVHNLRLPMALMALVVGATLAVGGAEIQTLLNNPKLVVYFNIFSYPIKLPILAYISLHDNSKALLTVNAP